jgi:hypothetical protein
MKIGIIGAGNIGGGFGRLWARRGHAVRFGVRESGRKEAEALAAAAGGDAAATSVAEAARFGEVVMLAVPWQAVPEVLAEAGDLAGKVLIDCTNALKWDAQGPIWAVPAAEEIARQRPGARVVKAFNTLGAEHLGRLGGEGSVKPDAFLCGDDEAARQVVRSLGEEIGFGVVDAGPLRNARVLEHLAVLWIHLAMKGGLGREIFFKVMRPGG